MLKRPLAHALCALIIFAFTAVPGHSQDSTEGEGLIDGVTVGVGLSTFFGEIDDVRGVHPLQHLAQSQAHALVGVDRDFSIGRLGLEASYNRFTGSEDQIGAAEDGTFEVEGHLIGVDAIYSLGFDVLQEGFFRVYLGVGATYVHPEYTLSGSVFEDIDQTYQDGNWSVNLAPPRVLITNPVGIMIDDKLRLGVRVTWTDYVDGIRFKGSPWDYVTNITLGWRFDL